MRFCKVSFILITKNCRHLASLCSFYYKFVCSVETLIIYLISCFSEIYGQFSAIMAYSFQEDTGLVLCVCQCPCLPVLLHEQDVLANGLETLLMNVIKNLECTHLFWLAWLGLLENPIFAQLQSICSTCIGKCRDCRPQGKNSISSSCEVEVEPQRVEIPPHHPHEKKGIFSHLTHAMHLVLCQIVY